MKKTIAILLSFLIMVFSLGCSNDSEYKDLLSQADSTYRQGNYELAKEQYVKISREADSKELREKADKGVECCILEPDIYKANVEIFTNSVNDAMKRFYNGNFQKIEPLSCYYIKIYVNPSFWNKANEQDRDLMVNRVRVLNNGLWHAYGIEYRPEMLRFEIIDAATLTVLDHRN